ncbi:MAG: tRNA (N(6)-L-threonylcarbamoyladenosine(37)-C(2))-methylthiotransferase MtaB [Acidobacteriota bacterium]|nr:tRNA (N(6)-L-threonylcarbamoyladenosine(37)-C(2))-methylthiotransferase MtaB [Acidobacteriota bacterium]
MPGYYMENFGCRATQADAAAIERRLAERGFRPSDAADADLVVVNTCTVTASADSRARQAIRAFHRRNPGARILVTGCYAQRAPEELAELDGVRWVIGNAHQHEIAKIAAEPAGTAHGGAFVSIDQLRGVPQAAGFAADDAFSLARGPAKILTGNLFEQRDVLVGPIEQGGAHTRPTLKIQDGCNHRCAYCVIPHVRGRSRSLAPERVVEEITRLACAGAREVVLSGINLGGYGRDFALRTSLADLLDRVIDETPVERLRLSSLEPMHLTADLIDRIASSNRIAPHFHIPLQSGSDRILAAMHRWYRAEHYARRIELIAERMPDAAVGADVIAGFPGETEADHRATVELVRRLAFSYLHVFSFSPRPGTEAARLPGAVRPDEIRERSRELRALAAEKAARFRASQSGRVTRALTLQTIRDGATDALTGNYLTVSIPGVWRANEWHTVRLRELAAGNLEAERVSCV